MEDTQGTVSILMVLLLISSAVAMATKWIRLPYTLALVIVGLVISPMHFLPAVHISPELILMIFLPALLFEAAWNLKLDELRVNLVPILLLAVVGVVLSVGVISQIMRFGAGLPTGSGLLFGAIISATDPVSVIAVFRQLGLPARLTSLVEGESLLNDGTAVVLFRIVLGVVIGTKALGPGQIALNSLQSFGVVVFGGMAVGAVVGLVASTLTAYFDDHLLEITLTTIAAYGSFLLGEGLHVSPVIAVLATGLIIGNYGRRTGMSAVTQVAVNSFWEYAAFVVNSLMFLLIGLEIQISTLTRNAVAVAWGIVAVLAARVIAVYVLVPVSSRFSEPVSLRWRHVLFWGGLRGALSIALALSLPTNIPARSELIAMVFGAVIFSLLIQGLTIAPLLKWLKLSGKPPEAEEYEILNGRLLLAAAETEELNVLRANGCLNESIYEVIENESAEWRERDSKRLAVLQTKYRNIVRQQVNRVKRRLIHVKKAHLSDLLREGVVSQETYRALNAELDGSSAAVENADEA